MPAAGVRNNDVSRQAHGIACRNVIAIGRALEEEKRTAESLGANRAVGAVIVFSAICLLFSSLFPDKRAIFGLMVAAVIIAALAYVNRESIRMYTKAKRNPGHRNPR